MAETEQDSGPLSSKQKQLINDTWAKVRPDLQGAGLTMFNR